MSSFWWGFFIGMGTIVGGLAYFFRKNQIDIGEINKKKEKLLNDIESLNKENNNLSSQKSRLNNEILSLQNKKDFLLKKIDSITKKLNEIEQEISFKQNELDNINIDLDELIQEKIFQQLQKYEDKIKQLEKENKELKEQLGYYG